jgi:predicted DNA-binding protein YlxM (UPF0122 family)
MKLILTEKQTILMRRLYTCDIPLSELAADYVKVIVSCLDTIDDLRVALRIARKEGLYKELAS